MSKFQRRHYEAIAEVLKDETLKVVLTGNDKSSQYYYGQADELVAIHRALVKMFKADNPRFKESIFDKWSGIKS